MKVLSEPGEDVGTITPRKPKACPKCGGGVMATKAVRDLIPCDDWWHDLGGGPNDGD